jgi:tetratricopeptide (TPR) repeat protein
MLTFAPRFVMLAALLAAAVAVAPAGAASSKTPAATPKATEAAPKAPEAGSIDHSAEYGACMALTEQDPQSAYRSGLAWLKAGGGIPARHCTAIALLALGDAAEAATRLQALAGAVDEDRVDLRIGLLAQAGEAWLAARRPDAALAVQSAVIGLAPDNAGFRVDRAITEITLGRLKDAIADLGDAVRIAPDQAEAYHYRATAKRLLDDVAGAMADIDRALALAPGFADALVERGILRSLTGDIDGARLDFLAAIEVAPREPIAEIARRRIEEIDGPRR